MQGLIDLMGGKEKFIEKMDSVFTTAPTYDYSYYGIPIHEITEMLIMNMGQCAHGNQPIQHMPYLYCYAGVPWKTQYHVREIMDKLYTDAPDGLCGDEDNGQTSAWYVFSALGMYPVASSSNQYVLGSPLFKKCTLNLENGNTFIIDARSNSEENYYISKAKLNHKEYTRNFLEHGDIMKGGIFELIMSNLPNKKRGVNSDDFPYSMSKMN
jgi:predicted alpha-1,2-mannosidase